MPRYSVWLNHSHSPVGCDLSIASLETRISICKNLWRKKETTPGGRLREIRLNFIVLQNIDLERGYWPPGGAAAL